MTEADRFLREMGIPRYDELGDEHADEAGIPNESSAAKQTDNVIPPALAARPTPRWISSASCRARQPNCRISCPSTTRTRPTRDRTVPARFL